MRAVDHPVRRAAGAVCGRTRPVPVVALGLLAALALAAAAGLAGLLVGASAVPPSEVPAALLAPRPDVEAHLVVQTVRLPRTLLALLVGAAMGAAGALMQGLTRNPLADPGILGVNAGAALAVVCAIAFLPVAGLPTTVWFAFAGAAVTSVVVYLLGSGGPRGGSPLSLVLAGAAVTIMLQSAVGFVLLSDRATNEAFRFWTVGSVAGRDLTLVAQVTPFLLAGLVIAMTCGRLLNAVALGDDVARALGQRVGVARVAAATAVVLLCGAGTAAAGPVAFVGFLVPHLARAVTGPDHRWILPYSAALGAALLTGADVLGRIVVAPEELPAGVVAVLVGGPVFVLLARRRRLAEL